MAINVGSLFASLTLQSDQFTQGMRDAQDVTTSTTESMKTALRDVGKELIAGFGAYKIGEFIGSQIRQAYEYAASLGDVAAAAGVTIEQYQVLGRAAESVGASQEQMDSALKRLTSTLGEANAGSEDAIKKFDQLGISKDQLASFHEAGDVLPYVMEGIKNTGDAAEQAAQAKRLFGDAAADLIPILTQGAEGYDAMTVAAQRAGLITAEQANAANQASNSIDLLATTFQVKLTGAIATVLPMLQQAVDWLVNIINYAGKAYSALREVAIFLAKSEETSLYNRLFDPEAAAEGKRRGANLRAEKFREQMMAGPSGASDFKSPVKLDHTPNLDLTKTPKVKKPKAPKKGRAGVDPLKDDRDLLKQLQQQVEALNYSGAELEVFNNLSRVGATEQTELGKAIADTTRQLYNDKALKKWTEDLRDFVHATNDDTALVGLEGRAKRYEELMQKLKKMRPDLSSGKDDTIVVTGFKPSPEEEEAIEAWRKQEKALLDDHIKGIDFEREQLGRNNVEKKVYNELRREGLTLGDADGQRLADSIRQYEAEAEAVKKAEEAKQHWKEAGENFADIGINMFDSLIWGTKNWSDVFRDTLKDLGQLMLEELVYRPLKEMLANFGTNLLTSLAGSVGGSLFGGSAFSFGAGGGYDAVNANLMGMATGGSIKAGEAAWVGERGPEIFRPTTDGQILPANRSGGSGKSMTFNIDARGSSDPAETRRQAQAAILEALPLIRNDTHAYTIRKLSRRNL